MTFLSASCSSANMRGGGRAETRDIRRPRSIVKQLGRGVAQTGGAKAGGAVAGHLGSISIEAAVAALRLHTEKDLLARWRECTHRNRLAREVERV